MELGITTFAESHPLDGAVIGHGERLRQVLAHIRLTGRLADIIYSLEATNTVFHAHQFKPVFLIERAQGLPSVGAQPLARDILRGEIGQRSVPARAENIFEQACGMGRVGHLTCVLGDLLPPRVKSLASRGAPVEAIFMRCSEVPLLSSTTTNPRAPSQ